MKPRAITVLTHQYPEETTDAIRRLIDYASDAGVEVRLSVEEAEKHGLEPRDGMSLRVDADGDTDLAVVLGGDGTILTALRMFAGRKAPVFAINYGAIGFLSTIDHGGLDDGLKRALAGESCEPACGHVLLRSGPIAIGQLGWRARTP